MLLLMLLLLLVWPRRYRPLMERIEHEQAAVWQKVPDADKEMVSKSGSFGGRNVYGPLLVLLKADKLAVLVRLCDRYPCPRTFPAG